MWVPQRSRPVHFYPSAGSQVLFGVAAGVSIAALLVDVTSPTTVTLTARDTEDVAVTVAAVELVLEGASPPGGGLAYCEPWV